MKLTKYQNDEERSIITALIVNDRILGRVCSKVTPKEEPFRSKWANLVFRWCSKFYTKYQKAPRHNIRALFRHFAEKSEDESSVAVLEKFLTSLSDDYAGLAREMNEDYLVDLASRYFNRIRCEREKDQVEADLINGDVDEAMRRMSSFTPITLATDAMVEVFTDKTAIREALQVEENEVVIRYGGALGEFFDNQLQRDGFIAFLAPEKRGKTFWLLDMAWHSAILNRRRTIFYSVGDMSQKQMMRRFITRAARRPLNAGECSWPKAIRKVGGKVQVRNKSNDWPHHISLKEARLAVKKVQMRTAHTTSLLKMCCTPNSTTRVQDIETDIERLIREGWIPDTLVLDYADILAPESGVEDFRHQEDRKWKALRRLSQKYHMLVVTATQSNAASYEAPTLKRSHFSEDKRKLAHVTGMVGINQTEEEKRMGVYRLNWVALREGTYYESKCVTTAGQLALANPAMVSCW